jgi:hypothetical protein
MEKELISKIKSTATMAEGKPLFGDPKGDLETACVDYLKYRGYHVVKSDKYAKSSVKNLQDLISLFYGLLSTKLDKAKRHDSYRNPMVRDLATAKRFVKSRMEANGVSEDLALNECANIIKTVFKHYHEFNFKYDVSFSIFGQQNLAWVTEKAIQILNRKIKEEVADRAEARRQEAIATHHSDQLGFDDLDEILKVIKEEEENGS